MKISGNNKNYKKMDADFVKKFQRGDIVQLKSGGPIMTVDDYEIWHDVLGAFAGRESKPSRVTEIINCTWFDKTQRKFGKFHQDLLDKATK